MNTFADLQKNGIGNRLADEHEITRKIFEKM